MFSELTRDYCQRYAVRAIRLSEAPGVVAGADTVCNIDIDFSDGYRVQFKLPAVQALSPQGVSRLEVSGEVQIRQGRPAAGEADLRVFFKEIESRLAKIQHEQSVQNISYLGNTFVLDNKTIFDVVADDDGRLSIEMHRGDRRQEAMLLASSLLDGLYDGSIKPA
jgi:hypothetical protein